MKGNSDYLSINTTKLAMRFLFELMILCWTLDNFHKHVEKATQFASDQKNHLRNSILIINENSMNINWSISYEPFHLFAVKKSRNAIFGIPRILFREIIYYSMHNYNNVSNIGLISFTNFMSRTNCNRISLTQKHRWTCRARSSI